MVIKITGVRAPSLPHVTAARDQGGLAQRTALLSVVMRTRQTCVSWHTKCFIAAQRRLMRKALFTALLAVATLSACKKHSDQPPAADNTAKNARDPATTPTADNAVNNTADRDLTQKIRKAVMDDSSLSSNAHNCKIVVQDGTVTLVGPVASDAERTKLEQIAAANAGDRKVINQLEVTK